ncbi:hypothetical protein JW960_01300 [candidate division KSB1 bacterium]|nr:hypothetical protein [candidate division KSB1 bacterium]
MGCAIWESDGRITDEGYIVEMSIPFSSLNFPRSEGEQTWGFDAVRSYPRSVRHHIGAWVRDRNNNCYMCQADKLVGFAGVTPGRNIEFDPTMSGIITEERVDETARPFHTAERKFEPGLTAQWGVTPNLTLSTTLNPDFSNVESDILQLDINNQFAIYYPEKRQFFLEGADFFSTPFTVVHTRSSADPKWGVKFTGKEGASGIGYYTVQDNITNILIPGTEGSDSDSYNQKSVGSVFRYKRDVLKSSNLGLILTDREGENYFNRLGGIDGDFKFTQKNRVTFQVLQSNTSYTDSIRSEYDQRAGDITGTAWYAHYWYNTRSLDFFATHEEVDRPFRADLGFITQVGYKYDELAVDYQWQHDPGYWYTIFELFSSFNYRRDQSGNLLHRAYAYNWYYEGPKQSHAHIYGEFAKDYYDGAEFRLEWLDACTGLYLTPALFVHLYGRFGDRIDYANTRLGQSILLNPNILLRIGLHIKIEASHTYEHLDVAGGRLYKADISYLKLMYQFNKRTFLRTIFQYKNYKRNLALYIDDEDVNARTQKLFTQILFSYKINPQTMFFLGYSDDYLSDQEIDLIQTNRTVFTKIGYAYTL